MIYVLNNLSDDYNVILNGLENCHDSRKIESPAWLIKNKKEEKVEKRKTLGAYNKQL